MTWLKYSLLCAIHSLPSFFPCSRPCISAFFPVDTLPYLQTNRSIKGSALHGDSEWPWMYRIKHNGYQLKSTTCFTIEWEWILPTLLTGFARFLAQTGTAVTQWLSAVLQIGRSLVRSQLVSLEFFIRIILPIALWPWGRLNLQQKWVPGVSPGGKGGRCVRLTTYHHPVPLSCNMGTLLPGTLWATRGL